jgi:putative transposase
MAEPFFSTTVEADSYLWAVERNIKQNPVKSKLVIRPEDYCRANISGQGTDWSP